MEASRKPNLLLGIILIILGVLFLAYQLIPALHALINWENAWPLLIVGVGVAFFVGAVLGHVPGLAIPGSVIGGIGLLLFWQNTTGDWGSWAYAWALLPGFVGVGLILMGVLGEKPRKSLASGLWLIVISSILFLIFGSFLGGFGFGAYWPILLIGLGFIILLRPLFRSRL